MGFSENLREQREKAGYTAKEFASLLGLKYSTYAAYENQGSEPKYDTLCKIAAALRVTTDELLGYKVDKYGKMFAQLKEIGFLVKENGKTIIIFNRYKGDYYSEWIFPTKEELYKVFDNSRYIYDGLAEGLLGDIFKNSLITGFNNYMEQKKQSKLFDTERSTDHE